MQSLHRIEGDHSRNLGVKNVTLIVYFYTVVTCQKLLSKFGDLAGGDAKKLSLIVNLEAILG